MDYFWPLLPLLFPSVFRFLFTCTPFSRMQHEIGTSFPILIYSLPLPLGSPGFPPPLCVIHNRTSAGLHVSHMGGTPVFFNTFLIPPFEAPLVHYNLYWLLNKIKGLVLAASRLCCTLLQKNAFFITHTHTHIQPHTPWYVYFDMKVGLWESAGSYKSFLISSSDFPMLSACVCVVECSVFISNIAENTSVLCAIMCIILLSLD